MSSVPSARCRQVSKSAASRPTRRETASFPSGPPRSSGASAPLSRRVLPTTPLGRPAVRRRQPRAGHRDRRRPETRGERPRPRPVSIPGPYVAHPRRPGRPQGRLQLLLHNALDGVADPLAHHALDRVRADLAPFSRFPLPAIASHGVILRHPLPSGRSCGSTAPDDDAFLSLFHHTPDITTWALIAKLSEEGKQSALADPSASIWPPPTA